MTRRYLALMIAPVSPSNGHTVAQNIATAKLWYPFLREITADLPITIVCPWLVGILLGDEDSDPAQRERAMVDSETGAARCDLTIAVGEAHALTKGMAREDAACPGPCVDLLDLGREYVHPGWMGFDRREDIRDRLRQALLEVQSIDPLPPFCDGCGQEIDPTTCGCGSAMPCYEHGIPMGCSCLRVAHGDGAIAKGLRERLRAERAARGQHVREKEAQP